MEHADALMERAISLASMSMGRTSPNPMVGAKGTRSQSLMPLVRYLLSRIPEPFWRPSHLMVRQSMRPTTEQPSLWTSARTPAV